MTATAQLQLGEPPQTLVCTISECGRYRYDLGEIWDEYRPIEVHVLCNPSTADFTQQPRPKWDHTSIKIREFAARRSVASDRGCGGWIIVNPFALRSRDPKALRTPGLLRFGGPENRAALDRWMRRAWNSGGRIIVGWGDAMPRELREQAQQIVLESVPADGPNHAPLWCYGLTKNGQPKHPLTLAYSTPLVPWGVR